MKNCFCYQSSLFWFLKIVIMKKIIITKDKKKTIRYTTKCSQRYLGGLRFWVIFTFMLSTLWIFKKTLEVKKKKTTKNHRLRE